MDCNAMIKGAAKAVAKWLNWGKAQYDALSDEDKRKLQDNARKLSHRVLKGKSK